MADIDRSPPGSPAPIRDTFDAPAPAADRSQRKRDQANARMRKHRELQRCGVLRVEMLFGPELLDQLILIGGLTETEAAEPSAIARVAEALLCAAATDALDRKIKP
jgi:hypothetical protein